MTLSITATYRFAEYCNAECHVQFIVTLRVIKLINIMLSVIMLSVIMLTITLLSVIMLSVIMLSDIMLNVVAPKRLLDFLKTI